MLEKVRSGDTIKIYRLDRLGRSLPHLISLIEELNTKGIDLISLSDHIDTQSSSGKLMFHIFGAMADFERNLIIEMTKTGLNAARERGRTGGRPKGLSPQALNKANIALRLYDSGETTIKEIMERLGIKSKSTFYGYIKFARTAEKEHQYNLFNKPHNNSL